MPRLEEWLTQALDAPAPVSVASIELITGGRSNLTYRVTITDDAGAERPVVLRRPPLGHVLPTAHDMSREFRVLTGLDGTRVPVARPIAICADADVIGAPFYVMDFVPGRIFRTLADAAALTKPQATMLSEALADMIANIHGVDVTAVGLNDLGRGAGYLRRQLNRWQRQWELSATRTVPEYDTLVRRLDQGMPAEGDTTLVHGDFRIDNVLVDITDTARIAAVVDWEMATLGDPLADLGLTLVYWTEAGEGGWLSVSTDATAAPGFHTRAEFAAAYAGRTGRDVSRIEYYMAFGYFKLAVVLEGINARYLQHQTVGDDFDREGKAVPLLIARAHQVLDAG